MRKKVLILYGGTSKERAISLETGKQVAKELKKKYSIKLSHTVFGIWLEKKQWARRV